MRGDPIGVRYLICPSQVRPLSKAGLFTHQPPHAIFSIPKMPSSSSNSPLSVRTHLSSLASMKRIRTMEPSLFPSSSSLCILNALSEEILLTILDKLTDPLDKKSWSLVCKWFHTMESDHRKRLKPVRPEFLPAILKRYRNTQNVDFSLCPVISDDSLQLLSELSRATLASVNLSQSKMFTHVGISHLALNCSNLVEIDVSNASQLTDLAAGAISKAGNLQILRMVRCKQISDLGVGCIAVGCRKLRLLGLRWCLGISDLGVGLVAIKCKELRSLDLSYTQITSSCIQSLVQLEYLEDLSLAGCLGIDDQGFTALKKGSNSLKALDMSYCENISQSGLSAVANGAPLLQQLTLAYSTYISDSLIYNFRNLPKLQRIKLDGCQVSCSGLEAIGQCCTTLTEFSLSKCKGVVDDGLCHILTRCPELRKLDITCCQEITYRSCEAIAKCKKLSSLRMESCCSVPKESFRLLGEQLHDLEEIDFTDNEIDDEGLKSFTKCLELTSLKVGICPNITNDGLVHISSKCPKLRELDLYRTEAVDDNGIRAIACSCPMLEMINMSYCTKITDDSLRFLSKCQQLSVLEMRGCPCISSTGLAAIAVGCRLVSKLDIKKCHIVDDDGILQLAGFALNLKQINLSYSSITDISLLALASIGSLQNITMLHLRGVSARGLEVALLVCGCLRKVKLNTYFKLLISPRIIDHMEARGCTFQWREAIGVKLLMKEMCISSTLFFFLELNSALW